MRTGSPLRLRFDAFEIDEGDARLSREGQPVPLPPKAFAVLCALAGQPGRLLSKAALLDAVWGHQHVSESVLKTTISELRNALDDDARLPRYIETVSRRGYRFIATCGAPLPATTQSAGSSEEVTWLHDGPPTKFVGRDQALTQLHRAWHAASAGRRQIVWLAGEAGIGKTTTIEHFLAEIDAPLVAYGHCVEQHGTGEPYLPVLEALASLTRRDDALAPLLRSIAPTWLLQLPWLIAESEREMLQRELAGTGQQRMLRELGELIDRYTERCTLVIVTEDLHWSDHATVQLIDHVARRRGPARLLWLISFRLAQAIAEEHPLKVLRHELRLHHLAEELVLESFSESEVAEYIDGRFPGHGVTERLVRALHSRTDGLPLFLASVMDELASQGLLDAESGKVEAVLVNLGVPESLAGVIEKQIARLAREDCELLEAASICGTEFRVQTLADALQRDVRQVADRCEGLVDHQPWLSAMLQAGDAGRVAVYAFKHALYRRVFYQRIGAARRAQLHRRVAQSMVRVRESDTTVTAAEIATHYELSGDPIPALRHYLQAAENALRRFSPVEAMSLADHALALLALLPPADSRDQLELDLLGPRAVAASQLYGTVATESTKAFHRIDALSERLPGKTRHALEMELGWVYQQRGDYGRACEHAQRKARLAEQHGDGLLLLSACNLMGATQFFQGQLASARRWLERGLSTFSEVAEQVDQVSFVMDPGASLHARLARVLSHQGIVNLAMSQSAAAVSRAEAIGQPYGLMYALVQAGIVELRFGRPERALQHGESLANMVSVHAVVEGEPFANWLRGCALSQLGQIEVGVDLLTRGHQALLQQGRIGAGCCAVIGYAIDPLLRMGQPAEAQARLDDALVLARRIGERAYLPDLLILEARLAAARGDGTGATRSLLDARHEAREQGALWLELEALVALCEREDVGEESIGALQNAYELLSEGFDTTLAMRAAELLGEAAGASVDDR